jgi:hypothetical protein
MFILTSKQTGVDLKSKDDFRHRVTIHKEFGQLGQIVSWCRDRYVFGEWGWNMVSFPTTTSPGCYYFYFNDEVCLFEFTLRWG